MPSPGDFVTGDGGHGIPLPVPFVADPDFTLYVGDVREVLAQLPAESVDCVVTSPPYWGLRDYGTGTWEGGDPEHVHDTKGARGGRGGSGTLDKRSASAMPAEIAAPVCSCGARRIDAQIGLEQSPDCLGWATGDECGECFVCSLVGVFREVRRVLAAHGTCWVNLGDSYASKARGSDAGWDKSRLTNPGSQQKAQAASMRKDGQRHRGKDAGLKEKDLAGVPWRVALALQADGWWLRSDVVWSKPNVMPESTTDRTTKSHEYVFLLAKSARYFYDQDAVREPASYGDHPRRHATEYQAPGQPKHRGLRGEGLAMARGERGPGPGTRNARTVWDSIPADVDDAAVWMADLFVQAMQLGDESLADTVWEIATQPYKGAHFAVFPARLAERCVLAGCPLEVCTVCGDPRRRIVEKGEPVLQADTWSATGAAAYDDAADGYELADESSTLKHVVPRVTIGWSDCGHGNFRPGVVLDPFMGSGTTALVARENGRHAVGVELNPEYARLAARRLQQLSLLAEDAA